MQWAKQIYGFILRTHLQFAANIRVNVSRAYFIHSIYEARLAARDEMAGGGGGEETKPTNVSFHPAAAATACKTTPAHRRPFDDIIFVYGNWKHNLYLIC